MIGNKNMDESINKCSLYNSYLVSINSQEELTFLYSTIADVPSYRSKDTFLTGVSVLGGLFVRYASGEDYEQNSNLTIPLTNKVYISHVGFKIPDKEIEFSAFICEKSSRKYTQKNRTF